MEKIFYSNIFIPNEYITLWPMQWLLLLGLFISSCTRTEHFPGEPMPKAMEPKFNYIYSHQLRNNFFHLFQLVYRDLINDVVHKYCMC